MNTQMKANAWMQAAAGPCRAQAVQGVICCTLAARCTLLDDALSVAVHSQVT
jgi:hypothetical protein